MYQASNARFVATASGDPSMDARPPMVAAQWIEREGVHLLDAGGFAQVDGDHVVATVQEVAVDVAAYEPRRAGE
jgi:hypothetical protein